MSWNERIKAAREAQKLTREQTVRKMRDYLPAGKTAAARTLVAWEQGDSEPKVTQAIALARALGYHEVSVTQAIALARALGYHEVSELFSQVDGPQLNRLGMDRLEEYRRLLLQSNEFREQPAVRRLRTLPVFLQPASAGTGQWLDDDLAEEMEVDDAVPTKAEFGVRLAGDSMSPRFADGQIVWARKAAQAENGEIVLCVLNEQGYCKKLKYDADGVYLVSMNPAYEPIPVQENDEFRIAGVVVG